MEMFTGKQATHLAKSMNCGFLGLNAEFLPGTRQSILYPIQARLDGISVTGQNKQDIIRVTEINSAELCNFVVK